MARAPVAPVAKDKDTTPSLIQIAFPQQAGIVFFSAIFLGLLIVFLPVAFRTIFPLDGTQKNLVLSIGLALFLAAFGGQATVRVGGIILAGVAALAVALFMYLQSATQQHFVQGILKIDYEKYKNVKIANKNQVVGSIVVDLNNEQNSSYQFVLIRDEMVLSRIVVGLQDAQGREIVTFHVSVAEIEPAFGSRQLLEWEVKPQVPGEDRPGLFDRKQNKFLNLQVAEIGHPLNPVVATLGFIVDSAHAEAGVGRIDVPLLVEKLKSDDTNVRRAARDALSATPVDAIPSIMTAFREQFADYRVRLGVCVALAQMLRADIKRSGEISNKLTEDDRNRLLDASADSDRTVRVYAAEFLFDLGDPTIARLAINRAATGSDDTARYNFLVAAQGGWRKLSAADKALLRTPMDQARQLSGPQTRTLLDAMSK